MKRPGPRPYECVRRDWHSERHQPLRASVIQQIFRVLNDAHSHAAKKNKEWQEKLLVVVLNAEEIMYSKANFELLRVFEAIGNIFLQFLSKVIGCNIKIREVGYLIWMVLHNIEVVLSLSIPLLNMSRSSIHKEMLIT